MQTAAVNIAMAAADLPASALDPVEATETTVINIKKNQVIATPRIVVKCCTFVFTA
jgi:hypothetical protein